MLRYMKKKMHSRYLLFLISIMLGLILVSGTVSATIYVNEDFEGEANNANPSATWYTYSESGFNVSNVSNANAYGGSQAFALNGTNSGNAYANFSFNTVTYYDWFSFRFNLTDISYHNSTNITFSDSSSNRLGFLNITNTTIYFYNDTQECVNVTIDENVWYRVVVDFNLTSNTIGIDMYNETAGGTLMDSAWTNMHTGGSYDNVVSVDFSADTGTKTSIWIDDFRRAYTWINPNQATQDAITSAMVVLLVVAIMLVIVAFALTGAVTPTQLISIAIISIIGVITAMIISGL